MILFHSAFPKLILHESLFSPRSPWARVLPYTLQETLTRVQLRVFWPEFWGALFGSDGYLRLDIYPSLPVSNSTCGAGRGRKRREGLPEMPRVGFRVLH